MTEEHHVTRGADSTMPLVSVLMAVHNEERFIGPAIRSILRQTFRDFEFLIVDDGSTDRSRDVIESFNDSRIRLVSRENRGLTASLNEGLGLARGSYVARQDADDLSLPTRLEREVALLGGHPEIGLVGTNYSVIDEEGDVLFTTSVFTHPDDLAVAEIISNQYGHGSVMIRKSVLDRVGGYDSSVGHVEDYDLFVRIGRVAELANIGEPLYRWRRNPEGVTLSNRDVQTRQALAVRDREFERLVVHRREFRLYTSFHPRGFFPSPIRYLEKKAMLFRDLSYLYRCRGMRRESLVTMLVAMLYAPWVRVSAVRLYMLLRDNSTHDLWEFEWL